MGHKTLVGGTAYDISGGKVVVGGTAYGIKKGRTLVGGTGYDVSFVTPLSDIPVGGSVFLNVDGVPKEFLVVHRGNPDSSLYDDSCDGTWLLMKDVYEERIWHSKYNDYENSDTHTYLNGTFLGLFDSDIQSAIKQVKLPYRKGSGSGKTVTSGVNGLAAKIFLLSYLEVGWTNLNNANCSSDGACLSYFSGCDTIDSKRIAYLSDVATRWWLRSPTCDSDRDPVYVLLVDTDGDWSDGKCSTKLYGIRPALILPHDALVDDAGVVIG